MTTPTTDYDIAKYIAESNLIESVTDPKEITQSMHAWDFLMKHEGPLTMDVVLDLHGIIMKYMLPAHRGGAGSLRINNVTVGGRLCPHYNEVKDMLDAWLAEPNADPKTNHIDFEHIHPFIDGNGRTGRMLMWWHEIQLDRVPTLITYEGRWDYYAWF